MNTEIPAPTEYAFNQIMDIVLRVFDYPVSKYTAVSANIKYLQSKGVIPHYATGRGRPASYSYEDVLKTLIGLELHHAGLTPSQIAPIFDEHWTGLWHASVTGVDRAIDIPTRGGRSVVVLIPVGSISHALGAALA